MIYPRYNPQPYAEPLPYNGPATTLNGALTQSNLHYCAP